MQQSRPLSTKQHAFIDYVWSLALPLVPRAFGWEGTPRRIFEGVAGVGAAQSAMTDYEGGGVRVLPMQAHLAMDGVIGVGLVGAGLLLRGQPTAVRMTLIGAGVFALAATALTEPIPRGKGKAHAQRTARLLKRVGGNGVGSAAGASR